MKIGRVKVEVGTGFIALLCGFYLMDGEGLLLPSLAAAMLHEVGHAIAARLCGAEITAVRLRVFGAKLELRPYPFSPLKELICAAAGPGAGVVVAAVSAWFAKRFESSWLYVFAGLNFALSLFNLLPACPLDGGRILRSGVSLLFGYRAAEISALVGGCAAAAVVCALCTRLTFYGNMPFSLWIFAVFVLISAGAHLPGMGIFFNKEVWL